MLQNKCMLSLPALLPACFETSEMQIKHLHLVIRCVNASCSLGGHFLLHLASAQNEHSDCKPVQLNVAPPTEL